MRVLLAEDEETIAVTLTDALRDAGHEVLYAPDTAEALKFLASSDPDVVLTDIRMPGEGGWRCWSARWSWTSTGR